MEFEGRAPIRQELSIAPLIDVVLLLLIFFMLTSTFYAAEAIDLDLPDATTATPADELPLVVGLIADGTISVDGVPVAEADLIAHLKTRINSEERAVTLKSDAGVNVQAMIRVMDAIRLAGGRRVSLATEEPR